MRGKKIAKMMLCALFYAGIGLIGCVSSRDHRGTKILEGTWENNNFVLVIKEHYYVSLHNNILYGMGQITYDGKHFILASTHAWKENEWHPFVETINGDCAANKDALTITNVEGRYSLFNGTWKKKSDIKLEEYVNNPPASVRAADVI
jgi:hypothetical protein